MTGYNGARGLPRALVLTFGMVCGILGGVVAVHSYLVLSAPTQTVQEWDTTKILCVGSDGSIFFLRNSSSRDFTLTDRAQIRIFDLVKGGLLPSTAELCMPIFIPAGAIVGVSVEPEPCNDLALFDVSRRYRIELWRVK